MTSPNFVILYVEAPETSAAFYADLFDLKPVELSPGFALFILPSGLKFGLWAKHDVQPAITNFGTGGELIIPETDHAAVDATYASWRQRGLEIAQVPTEMDFGYTFVAVDPDGHRLRVFAPNAS
ncbi:VOC family protein [Aquirhabdus parva]|uniref:Drug:proton antiporter n=1 Tax=Aquirhabdus parva TaxID=2283318 RepID=A0A345P8Y8_9GAMM|nr:VOC family protein [Aquirhabdus parva]AXI03747.1 drug:proton antiporter [Aquirhabdus parva]